MAWTAPRTWVVGEVLTAALLNTHLRDNMLETATAKATTQGDTFYATAANAIARLAKGTAGQAFVMNSGATAPEWGTVSSGKKTSGGGYFLIPAGPAVGTSVNSSASANTYGSWNEMIASTAAALFIVGVAIENGDPAASGYVQLDIGTGAGAAEVSVGEVKFDFDSAGVGLTGTVVLPFPIPVAISTRIACRTADVEGGVNAHRVSLICINQSDLANI